jgi:hypothetical protein
MYVYICVCMYLYIYIYIYIYIQDTTDLSLAAMTGSLVNVCSSRALFVISSSESDISAPAGSSSCIYFGNVCMHVRTYVCMYRIFCRLAYVRLRDHPTCISVCIYVCMYVCTCASVCMTLGIVTYSMCVCMYAIWARTVLLFFLYLGMCVYSLAWYVLMCMRV